MSMTLIRETERQALLAVERGEVLRVYRVNGNVLVGPKGVASKTLWRLDRNGLIMEGKDSGTQIEMVLTSVGRELMESTR